MKRILPLALAALFSVSSCKKSGDKVSPPAPARGRVGGFEQPAPLTTLILYWTSTEASYFQASETDFRYDGNTGSYVDEKRAGRDVRAVRKF